MDRILQSRNLIFSSPNNKKRQIVSPNNSVILGVVLEKYKKQWGQIETVPSNYRICHVLRRWAINLAYKIFNIKSISFRSPEERKGRRWLSLHAAASSVPSNNHGDRRCFLPLRTQPSRQLCGGAEDFSKQWVCR